MSESDEHRARAEEYSRLAHAAESEEIREKLVRMEQSYRLLAKNADWISATGAFIKEMRARPAKPATEKQGRSGKGIDRANAP